MKLHHGSERALSLHRGICLTEDAEGATAYALEMAGRGVVTAVDLALDGLRIEDIGDRGSRWEAGEYPGDRDLNRYAARGVDVLRYWDAAPGGREIVTYRLVTGRAVCRVCVIGAHKARPR